MTCTWAPNWNTPGAPQKQKQLLMPKRQPLHEKELAQRGMVTAWRLMAPARTTMTTVEMAGCKLALS